MKLRKALQIAKNSLETQLNEIEYTAKFWGEKIDMQRKIDLVQAIEVVKGIGRAYLGNKPELIAPFTVWLECLGGNEPARDLDLTAGGIGYDTGGIDPVHKFPTLKAAQEYAEFWDEFILDKNGIHCGEGGTCPECRGMSEEETGRGPCGNCDGNGNHKQEESK